MKTYECPYCYKPVPRGHSCPHCGTAYKRPVVINKELYARVKKKNLTDE